MSDGAFQGMSIREINGMPMTIDATVNMIAPNPEVTRRIAAAQDDYVRSVYERCPSWRWIKKRRLERAALHTARVRSLVEPRPATPTPSKED